MDRWWNDPTAFPDDRWGDGMFAAYRARPSIGAYLAHSHNLGMGWLRFPDRADHPVIGHQGDRNAYIREHTREYAGTDVLTLDGWWVGRDGDAVHATCDPARCPHERPGPELWQGSEPYLASLPGETILLRPRCHCCRAGRPCGGRAAPPHPVASSLRDPVGTTPCRPVSGRSRTS